MEREIKFRAFRKYPKPKMYYFNLNDLIFNRFNKQPLLDYQGVRESVMMYTGLKDKNGKEIYEGDIINAEQHEPSKYEIRFIEGGFCCWSDRITIPTDICHFFPSTGCQFEIIGNIHENNDLLTPKSK